MTFVKATNRHVRETSSDKGLFFPSYTHWSTQCFTMDFSDMAVRPDSLKELKEQLETEDAPAVFTNKSSLGIWQRNDPETYQWFCDTYKLNNRFSFYNEEFRYFTKR